MVADTFDHRPAAGVADPALRALLADHWEALMRRYPTWASRIGEPTYRRGLASRGEAEVVLNGLGPGRFRVTGGTIMVGELRTLGEVDLDGESEKDLTLDLR